MAIGNKHNKCVVSWERLSKNTQREVEVKGYRENSRSVTKNSSPDRNLFAAARKIRSKSVGRRCRGIDGGLLTVSGRMSKNYANESLPGNADELAERIEIDGQFV